MPHRPIDLHTHSHFSDGTLPPAEVVAMAAVRGVSVLALTDHDTTAGLACLRRGRWTIPVLSQGTAGAAWLDGSIPPPAVRAAIEAQRAIYALNQERAAENQRRELENPARLLLGA